MALNFLLALFRRLYFHNSTVRKLPYHSTYVYVPLSIRQLDQQRRALDIDQGIQTHPALLCSIHSSQIKFLKVEPGVVVKA